MFFLAIPPFLGLIDLNGGFATLGFVQTPMSEEYKVRPDYITETVFAARRQEVPTFKHFWELLSLMFEVNI